MPFRFQKVNSESEFFTLRQAPRGKLRENKSEDPKRFGRNEICRREIQGNIQGR